MNTNDLRLTRAPTRADCYDRCVNEAALAAWSSQRARERRPQPCATCSSLNRERCACARDAFVYRYLLEHPPLDERTVAAIVTRIVDEVVQGDGATPDLRARMLEHGTRFAYRCYQRLAR